MIRKFLNSLIKGKRVEGEPTDLRIDAELLCCPVCFELFNDAPHVIPCGHTICKSCLSRLTGRESGRETSFSCPMCRKSFAKNRRYPRNFMLEGILNSIDEWIETEANTEHSNKNSERIVISRLKEKVSVLSAENSQLKNEVEKMRRQKLLRLVSIGAMVGIGAMFILRLLV